MAVIKWHVTVHMLIQSLLVRKRSPVHPFGLHRMEERLHQGVVCHFGFRPVHALDNAQLRQTALHNESPIFDAAIGVKDQPTGRSTTGYGSVESSQSQPGILASTQTPTQDAPRVLVPSPMGLLGFERHWFIASRAATPSVRNSAAQNRTTASRLRCRAWSTKTLNSLKQGEQQACDPGRIDPSFTKLVSELR